MRNFAALLLGFAAALVQVAEAQDLPLRVGRVAYIDGRVSLYQDPDAGWEKAYVNSPLTSENSVWADGGSRAEVRVSGTAIRLDNLTQLDVARLDEDELDAFVARGSVALRVRHYTNNERLTFNTPNARVRILANGRYRIDVDEQRYETRITVFAGEARIGTDDGRMRVAAGRSVVIFGDPPEFYEEPAKQDGFDRWSLARDDTWREGRAPTYVSTYMTGYEELDGHGQWVTEPDYGVLWYPTRVAADWAPYRQGRWDYVRPWGWTWVDDAPWGYAPFHYGRWSYVRNRWAWVPGERIARPVWAPALVAWVGGAGLSVAVSSGPPVGWYPLSPYDRYQPWFNASPAYVNHVNVIVRPGPTRQDRRDWQRATRERGTTVVDRRALVESTPVTQAILRISPDALRQVQPAARPESLLPTRNDVNQRRRERPQQQVAPAPLSPITNTQAQAQAQAGKPAARQAIVRPEFGRNAAAAAPKPSTEASRQAQRANPGAARPQERATREQQQAQERAQRETQQRETQQQQDRAGRDARQQKEQATRQQQQAQDQAQRDQQQAKERAARDARQQQEQAGRQQQQQQQAQESAKREQQQAQDRAQREAQQQQQQRAQESAKREQAQVQERAQREAQQQQQRAQQQQQQAQESAKREQAQVQERAKREAQQVQQRAQQQQQQQQQRAQENVRREQQQAQESAKREQAQVQERAQREAQQVQQRAQQQQAQAARDAQQQAQRKKRDDDEKEKEKEKGKAKP